MRCIFPAASAVPLEPPADSIPVGNFGYLGHPDPVGPLICLIWPAQRVVLLAFHDGHEIPSSDARLDHNPGLQLPLTRVFVRVDYHLGLHGDPSCNYGLILTLWDRLSATAC